MKAEDEIRRLKARVAAAENALARLAEAAGVKIKLDTAAIERAPEVAAKAMDISQAGLASVTRLVLVEAAPKSRQEEQKP